MKKLQSFVIWSAVALTIIGCEEVINIDINQAPPQVVIDALLTDEDTTQTVRITRTAEFNGIGGGAVMDAFVQIYDDLGNRYTFTHNPGGYDSLQGTYYSDSKFGGITGRVYHLEVQVDSDVFTAQDTLRPITTIDSLAIREDPFAKFDPDNNGEIYQVLLYTAEPQNSRDFYYFRFYRDSLLIEDNGVYAFDDNFLGDRLDGLPSPVNFKEGELASVEIYSLTREQYVYFTDLANLLNNDGGMFSPPPANPRTNITGGALGIFQVSGLRRASILIVP